MLVFVSFHISKTLNSSKRGLNIRFHIPDRKSSFVFVLVLIFVIVFIVVILFVLAPPIRRMRTCLMTEQLSHTLSRFGSVTTLLLFSLVGRHDLIINHRAFCRQCVSMTRSYLVTSRFPVTRHFQALRSYLVLVLHSDRLPMTVFTRGQQVSCAF